MRARPELGVFAVEDDSVQLTWRGLGTGRYEIRVASYVVAFEAQDEPGAITIEGLEPQTTYEASMVAPRLGSPRIIRFSTLGTPPGELLTRLGLVGDLHLGAERFGVTRRIRERHTAEIPANRCAKAAVDELERWGVEHLFIKGDLVHRGTPSEWLAAQRIFANRPMSVEATLGNHETTYPTLIRDGLELLGTTPIAPVRFVDVPGVRVVTVETADFHSRRGSLGDRTDAVMEVVENSSTPVVIVTHHHFHRWALQPMLPRGIPRHEARPFLERLGWTAPNAMVISGHSHRHRRYDVGSVSVVETGSTKDYPGTWTGLAVYEGGVRQVVRRIERPDCMSWTDRTRRAALGAWRWWSPGRLQDRCFVNEWG